jgi:hypothetical protein
MKVVMMQCLDACRRRRRRRRVSCVFCRFVLVDRFDALEC